MRGGNFQKASTLGLPKEARQKFSNMIKFAEFCFPNGSTLRCNQCQMERSCSVKEIARFLTEGYPMCKKCQVRVELTNPHIKKP